MFRHFIPQRKGIPRLLTASWQLLCSKQNKSRLYSNFRRPIGETKSSIRKKIFSRDNHESEFDQTELLTLDSAGPPVDGLTYLVFKNFIRYLLSYDNLNLPQRVSKAVPIQMGFGFGFGPIVFGKMMST